MSAILDSFLKDDPGAFLQEAPPEKCPFDMPEQEKAQLRLLRLRQVPERLRALLYAVTRGRAEVNALKDFDTRITYGISAHQISERIERAAVLLDAELRHDMGLGPESIISSYEADWRFRVTTLRREFLLYLKKKSKEKKNGAAPTGGPVKNWTDEPPAHFQYASATFAQALARTRAKKTPPRK